MIKLIGMDFDGTLLNDSKEVTKKNKRYIKSRKRKKYKNSRSNSKNIRKC